MQLASFLALGTFASAVTSVTCGFHFTTDLIVPVTIALTIFQASPCLAYVVSPSASGFEGLAHVEHSQRDRPEEDDKKKRRGKHHGKNKEKNSAKHDHKDRTKDIASQTSNGHGTAPMCTSAGNTNGAGSTNTTMTGNSTGTLPPGFPPPVPQPGFVAGQKRKRQINLHAKRIPRSPARAVYETLYDRSFLCTRVSWP